MATSYWWSVPEIPIKWATEHFLIVGSTGSGKTVVIRTLMDSVFSQSGARRAIIFDPKRENYPQVLALGIPEKRVHILNPFDARCVPWNMSEDIPDFATAEEIATILIPPLPGENQPFFRDASRQLAGTVMKIFIHCRRAALAKDRNSPKGRWTLRDLICAMRLPQPALAALFKKFPFAHHALFYFDNDYTFTNIRSGLETHISKYAIVAALWDSAPKGAREKEEDGSPRGFSLKNDWMERPSVILLGREPAMQSALEPINLCLVQRASQLVLEQPERSHAATQDVLSWFIFDELKAAGKMGLLPDLMTQGRSKGACVVLGMQNLAGISSVYGHTEALDLLSQCANKAILRLQDAETANWAVSLVGQNYILKQNAQFNENTSSSRGSGETQFQRGSGTTVSQDLQRDNVAMASTFWVTLRPAGPEVGLEGFFFVPTIPEACQTITRIAPEEIFGPGGPLDKPLSKEPPTEPRDAKHQELRPWDKEDLERLLLDDIPELLQAPGAKNPLHNVKRRKAGPPQGQMPG